MSRPTKPNLLERFDLLGLSANAFEQDAGLPQGFVSKARRGELTGPRAAPSWRKFRDALAKFERAAVEGEREVGHRSGAATPAGMAATPCPDPVAASAVAPATSPASTASSAPGGAPGACPACGRRSALAEVAGLVDESNRARSAEAL